MEESKERRKFKRRAALTRAIIHFNDGKNSASLKGLITEISCGGLGVTSKSSLFSAGTEVIVEVGPCPGLRSFQAKAIIKQIDVNVQNGESFSSLGLEFVKLNPMVLSNIESFVGI